MQIILSSLFILALVIEFNASDSKDIKQNFPSDVEDALNAQINLELKAFYIYEAMASYFQRPDIGLEGFEKFFRKSSNDELGHARKMIEYMNKRGGTYKPKAINLTDTKKSWSGALDALTDALQKEKDVNQELIKLHILAENLNDPNAQDFVDEFLKEQVDSIASLRVIISRLDRMKTKELAEFLVDQELKS